MHRFLVTAVLFLSAWLSPSLESAEDLRTLRMIIVRDQPEARDIRQQLRKGASFSALAGAKSIGPQRRSWGYSGTFRLTDVQPALRSILQLSDLIYAVWSLKTTIKTRDFVHLVGFCS